MNYAQLGLNISDQCEYTFEAEDLQLFTQQAEKLIYNSINIPALRKSVNGLLTTGNNTLALPQDFLWSDSFAVEFASGSIGYLLEKQYDFMREAYPNVLATGTPKYYGIVDTNTLRLGPAPDLDYKYTFHYGYYPESIVTAEQTWLGDNFGNVLLNAALVEAARFLKKEQDIIAIYEKLFVDSLQTMKNVVDGRGRQDTYRAGEPRQPAA